VPAIVGIVAQAKMTSPTFGRISCTGTVPIHSPQGEATRGYRDYVDYLREPGRTMSKPATRCMAITNAVEIKTTNVEIERTVGS